MDYKLKENKESLVKAKDALISDLDSMFTTMIDSDEKYKKAALLYYWLRDYKNYIKNEDRFDHSYLPAFKRGDIININFGFNLGSEHGGMHYGIVLADSIKKNPVVTVVPLKSPKEHAKLYYTDVDLSNELFDRLTAKNKALNEFIPKELVHITNQIKTIGESTAAMIEIRKTCTGSEPAIVEETLSKHRAELEVLKERLYMLKSKKEIAANMGLKLSKMKNGSIAMVSQIRCISKMSIIDPTNEYDTLYNVRLSGGKLDLIDQKLKELYTKSVDKT